jgi:hypothetical protein
VSRSHVGPGLVPAQEVGFSKNLLAIQLLARDLLTRVPGERIPTAIQYQQLTGVGSGTVQKALRTLQSVGAVQLRSRGHVGTFVEDIGLARLWALASVGAPTAVLPLPTSPELMGLATALREEFKRLEIPLQVLYTYGSSKRLDLVASGEADFTVMSGAAASDVASCGDRWYVSPLGSTSYYYEGSWVVMVRRGLDPADRGGLHRIGIDRSSHDHTVITESEFPEAEGYTYVEGNYTYMTKKVATGVLDALAWHTSALAIPLEAVGISVRPLERPDARRAASQMSVATVLTPASRKEVIRAVELLDHDSLASLQAKVVAQEVLPFY